MINLSSGTGRFNFNPLHREGGDINIMENGKLEVDFNPLHREGGDRFSMA